MIAHNMYAYNDNSTLRLIGPLPSRLRLPDGLTRTALDELDTEQLAELGIYPATEVKPVISTATQVYGEPKITLDGGKAIAVYPVIDKTKEQLAEELAGAKEAKLAELANARWEQETGGLTLPDGTVIKTDRESQGLLTGAAFSATLDPETPIEWKGANGWVVLTSQQVLQIAGLVRQHVQGCFSRERALSAQVEAIAQDEALSDAEKVEAIRAVHW